MVAGDGISDKCPPCIPHGIKKSLCVKERQITFFGFPSPVEIAHVWSPIQHAILRGLDREATVVGVSRARWVGNPLSIKKIAFLC